jgi:hypothetical protein
MEASGTPSPPPDPPAAGPPPPAAPGPEEERASAGWRILGVLLALALAFASAVMIVAMIDISGTPVFDDCITPPEGDCTEYFDGSSGQKTISVILGFVSGGLAGIGALLALYFAGTGRSGRLMLQITGAAIAFGAASLVIGSV